MVPVLSTLEKEILLTSSGMSRILYCPRDILFRSIKQGGKFFLGWFIMFQRKRAAFEMNSISVIEINENVKRYLWIMYLKLEKCSIVIVKIFKIWNYLKIRRISYFKVLSVQHKINYWHFHAYNILSTGFFHSYLHHNKYLRHINMSIGRLAIIL